MKSLAFPPPPKLEAYELEVDGYRFVLFEWDAPVHAPPPEVPLTPAQRAIVDYLLEGRSTRRIALTRGCSERTIANQIAAIFRKFGVHSRGELAAHFARAREVEA